MYTVTAKTKAKGPDIPGRDVDLVVGQVREVHEDCIKFYLNNPSAWDVRDDATVRGIANSTGGIGISTGDASFSLPQYEQAGKGIESAAMAPVGAWGVMPDGKFLCADFFPGAGQGRTALSLYTGDPLVNYSTANHQSLTATRVGNLKHSDGTAINTSGAHIFCAWPAANGDIFFVAVEGGNFYHLYRCKAGTFTVGAGAAATDGKPVVSLGMIGAVQTSQVRILTQASFCEATIAGQKHHYLAEYSVASGRINGGAFDAVYLHRSTDGGITWSKFLEFNTDGTHQVDHLHFVRQDPYTGWIYVGTGDNGAENALIAYDGKSAPVAANATLATIGATPGYRVISGSELHRYADLAFTPVGIYSIPDADTETSDPTTTAYRATSIDRMLGYVAALLPVARVDNIPPAICVKTPKHGHFFFSFCSSIGFGTYPYIDVWAMDYEGVSWTLVAKLEIKSGAVPRGIFADSVGRIWMYNDTSLWLGPESTYPPGSGTGSKVLTLGARNSSALTILRG